MILGVGHEPQDETGLVADSSNVPIGAIRIGRIVTVRRRAIASDVAKSNLVAVLKPGQVLRHKSSLSMSNRTPD